MVGKYTIVPVWEIIMGPQNMPTPKESALDRFYSSFYGIHEDDCIFAYIIYWLVVSTHLKNTSQNGNLPQVGMNIKNI